MQLAGNKNDSEINNGATCRCDLRGATRGSWVRGPIVGSTVRRSWVVGLLFVGSWVHATRYLWVRRSRQWCDDLHFSGFAISLSLSLCLRMWVLSLSLSLFARLRKWFEGKILAENIFRVKGLNFTVNWNSFPENPFFIRNQTPTFTEKLFRKWFEAKTNTALKTHN